MVVGGGPAAFGLLAAAAGGGDLDRLLDGGLALLDAGPPDRFGAGRLGHYRVPSDTRARVFVESVATVLKGPSEVDGSRLLAGCDHDEPVPLDLAARLLAHAGRCLREALLRRGARALPRARVSAFEAGAGGLRLHLAAGSTVDAERVVFATGGRPWTPPELPRGDRLTLHADALLRPAGARRVLRRLAGYPVPRAVVVGGSHSAFAAAGRLLRLPLCWPAGGIVVAHRSPVRVTYPDAARARADGVAVREADVCPATGVVYRFGGLRAGAARLYRRVRDGAEPRVRLLRLPDGWDWLDAPVVVAATGYAPSTPPLLGAPATYWDGEGRLCLPGGGTVPGGYGLGLGTGRRRDPGTGGEPSYRGAIDGVWFYQHVVAPRLLELMHAEG